METGRRERVRGRLLAHMPKSGVAAEIGVWEGQFSRRILEVCEPRELHLIDPWQYMPEFANTGFGRLKNAALMEEKHQSVVAAFADDTRVRIHRATSGEALRAMPDASLDWVYIDGNHNDPFIGEDLALCLQKVKPDGIIAGDDFNWQTTSSQAPVKRAVEAVVSGLAGCADLKLIANQYIIRLKRSRATSAA